MWSWLAMVMVLVTILLKPSTCPCAFGWTGVMRLCWNPDSWANSAKVCDWNGGPLSV